MVQTTLSEPAAALASRPGLTLYEDADSVIVLMAEAAASDRVVVTFDPIHVNADRPAFAQDFLARLAVDHLAVRKKHDHFYQALSREAFTAIVAPILARYTWRVAYGSSLGAYAALYFCSGLVDEVVASSPRNSCHPEFGVGRWQRHAPFRHGRFAPGHSSGRGVTILFDPMEEMDRQYVEQELRPAFPGATWYALRFAGHPSNSFLADIGFIAPFVRAVVSQRELPRLDLSRRKGSPAWLRVLSLHNTARGRPRWGRQIALHALALRPCFPPGLRALVQAELALGRPEAARSAIDTFASMFPAHASKVSDSRRALDDWHAAEEQRAIRRNPLRRLWHALVRRLRRA